MWRFFCQKTKKWYPSRLFCVVRFKKWNDLPIYLRQTNINNIIMRKKFKMLFAAMLAIPSVCIACR